MGSLTDFEADLEPTMRHWEGRLADLRAGVAKCVDALAKELREYEVRTPPLVLERLYTILRPGQGMPHCKGVMRHSRTFTWQDNYGHIGGVDVAKVLLELLYANGDPNPHRMIVVNVSTKIRFCQQGREKPVSMREFISRVLGRLVKRLNGRVPSLDLLIDELCNESGQRRPSPEHQMREERLKLAHVVMSETEPLLRSEAFRSWMLEHGTYEPLRLKSVYYVLRGDQRAFYCDTCVLRCMIGPMVEELFKSIPRNRKWMLREILPSEAKDFLAKEYILAPGMFARVVILDVSSFTASCPSWELLIVTLLELERNDGMIMMHKPILLEIDGFPVESSVFRILTLYLELTVGAVALNVETGESLRTVGTYLGVNASMRLTTIYHALICYNVSRRVLPWGVTQCTQVAGDDTFVFGYSLDEGALSKSFRELETDVNAYVGRLKEATQQDVLQPARPRFVLDSPFCKKRVEVTVMRTGPNTLVSFNSIPSMPVQEEELSKTPVKTQVTKRAQSEATVRFEERRRGVSAGVLVNFERGVQEMVHGLKVPVTLTQRTELRLRPATQLVDLSAALVSLDVLLICSRIPDVVDSMGTHYRSTVLDKAWYLVRRGKAEVRTLYDLDRRDRRRTIIYAKREFAHLFERLVVPVHDEGVGMLEGLENRMVSAYMNLIAVLNS
jgi:hypothetical protein